MYLRVPRLYSSSFSSEIVELQKDQTIYMYSSSILTEVLQLIESLSDPLLGTNLRYAMRAQGNDGWLLTGFELTTCRRSIVYKPDAFTTLSQ